MDLYKNTLLNYLKIETVKNSLLITIIRTTLEDFNLKILRIVFSSMRRATHYHQIMFIKFGLSQYAEKTFYILRTFNWYTRNLFEKNEPTLGIFFWGGGVHGKVCWLIAYFCI